MFVSAWQQLENALQNGGMMQEANLQVFQDQSVGDLAEASVNALTQICWRWLVPGKTAILWKSALVD